MKSKKECYRSSIPRASPFKRGTFRILPPYEGGLGGIFIGSKHLRISYNLQREMASRLWKFLTTDIGELFSAETVTEGTEAAAAVLELAGVLQEEGTDSPQLAPLVGRISTLLDVLNSPLMEVVGATLPFVSIGVKLLGFYLEKTKKQPTLEQCVALVSQVAYLESFRELINHETILYRIRPIPVSAPVQQQIRQLGELVLEEKEAENAVACFHESKLAQEFGTVLAARLQEAGLEEKEADILTRRVAWNTPRYMMEAWNKSGEAVKHWGQSSFSDWRQELEKYKSIDDYLNEQIQPKPLESVFTENFTFRDIYVPLKAKPINKNGEVDEDAEAFDLETWATDILQWEKDRVIFVQGGPGRGKSVFCRMFADWVRQHFYPIWIPILIRLRDIPKLQPSFRETLREAVAAKFANDVNWLVNRNTQYLFVLDGFDELLMEGRTSGGLKDFLQQVGQFQKDSQLGKDMGHRVLLTGRTLALQSIERQMPDNLERVRIEVMDDELQGRWLEKWDALVGAEKRVAFEGFLRNRCCPLRVRELAREPLLLYLLAAMHRDGQLQVEAFEGVNSTEAKIHIYEQFLDWVLTKQRPEWLQRELTAQDTENLRRILAEAGLCVAQSGGEFASIKVIESRLKLDEQVKALLEEAQKQIGDNPLRNALAAFYLQKGSKEGSVEFAHKSFGEFLCAERLKNSLLEWTEPGKRRKRFDIPDEQLHWEIYDLLGYGALTPEIVDYLMGLLTREAFCPMELFERLEDFYFRWCDGEFIDVLDEDLPRRKRRQLREQGVELGLRQVDVYAGLNVMILLLELHRYGREREELEEKMAFYPCGKHNAEGKLDDDTLLFRIIGYSRCIGDFGFLKTVGKFLRGANLSRADLSDANLSKANLFCANLSEANFFCANLSEVNLRGANLRGANLFRVNLFRTDFSSANLSDADLSGANLSDADLSGANLSGTDFSGANLHSANLIGTHLRSANLSGADLSDTNLRGANLSDANLRDTNLSDANLRGANLRGTNLRGANLSDAIFGDVRWDEDTKWENVRGLESALNVPEALRRQLGL